jgi:hypothetical protein
MNANTTTTAQAIATRYSNVVMMGFLSPNTYASDVPERK